ncbi:hypothetical protein [Microbacterium sp. C7(2022)]|uniref:hypothetical protein n=1 Tax=Microbacterium sp. C7(2022) TaxID=2992759 RepID=UPI00237C0007|nr:hypothetical protein [Microbacterium sp. C7(2022)]MDE0545190.1 hypothetical protein [Microbacterium sp. C7(2022)]
MAGARKTVGGAVLAFALGALMTGCASASPEGSGAVAGDAPIEQLDAAWLDSGRMVGIVTMGSSSCMPLAEVGPYTDGTLEVSLTDDPAAACTRDLAPRVSVVALPVEVDPTQGLDVVVTGGAYDGIALLAPLDAGEVGENEDLAPSAGWTGAEGQFAVLTWGSSSCAPVVDTAEVTGDTEITVTFASAPSEQVCTMDMAPRANLVAVDASGLGEGPVVASFTGGEFVGTVVPILGER